MAKRKRRKGLPKFNNRPVLVTIGGEDDDCPICRALRGETPVMETGGTRVDAVGAAILQMLQAATGGHGPRARH